MNAKKALKRISVAEAAERLGIPEQAVRAGIDQGKLPIEYSVGKHRKTYYIFEDFVERYLDGERS